MYFMGSYAFNGWQIHIVIDGAATCIQCGDGLQLFSGQGKIENIEVFRHSFFPHALGDNDHVTLVEPAQDDLPRAFAMLPCDFFQYRMVENIVLAFGKRCPRLMLDGLFLQERIGSLLLEKRMRFYLIDGRLHLIVQEKVLQAFIGETGYSDGADTPLLV